MFRIIWKKSVLKKLKSLDKSIASKIYQKVETHLALDPVSLGKPLGHKFRGFFSFRSGDYRVIYSIKRAELYICVVKVGHRKDIYEE